MGDAEAGVGWPPDDMYEARQSPWPVSPRSKVLSFNFPSLRRRAETPRGGVLYLKKEWIKIGKDEKMLTKTGNCLAR